MNLKAMPSLTDVMENKRHIKVAIALTCVYIFWGGTYLGMKIAIETMPPLIMAGARFLIAGFVLYIILRVTGAKRPSVIEWRGTGIVGALLLLGGNGVVAWAEQRVPSGIAALLIATVPLWIIVLGRVSKNKEKTNLGVKIGVAMGLIGILILVIPQGGLSGNKGIDLLGIMALIFAALSWSIGSLYSRSAQLPQSPLLSTSMQMIVGGALLMLASFFLGEWSKLDIQQITPRSYISLGYLIIFGSIVGYNAYIWLLKNAEPSLVSTYAFINPIVAVFLGWLILGEGLTINSMVSAIVIIAAVFVITFSRSAKKLAS